MFTKKQPNPLEFVKMVRWHSKDKNFDGVVGYTKNGDIYLTWDVKENVPIFFPDCKIGVGNNLEIEDFKKFEEIYDSADIEERWKEELKESFYYLYRYMEKCHFKKKEVTEPTISLRIPSYLRLSFK